MPSHSLASKRALLLPTVTAGLGVAVAATAGLQGASGTANDFSLILIAVVLGGVLLMLAYFRFELFLLIVLSIRASVDWTKASSVEGLGHSAGSGVMTSALGLLFLVTAVLWLLVQFHTRRLVPLAPLSVAWIGFLGVCVVSALGADGPVESLAESARIATAVVMLIVLQQLLQDRRKVRTLLAACYASAIVPLLMAAYQASTGIGISVQEGISRVRGTFVHSNAFGFYLSILLIMGVAVLPHISRRVRPLLLIVLWSSAVAVILTYSRGSWLALLLGLVVVGVLQSRRSLLPLLGVTAVLILTIPPVTARLLDLQTGPRLAGIEGNSLVWRFDYWATVVDLANESPLVGIGPKMTQFATDEAKVPHNDFLRAYVETGILGFTAYAIVIANLVLAARRATRAAPYGFDRGVAVGFSGCVAAYILFSVGENLMTLVVALWYFLAFAASGIAVSQRSLRPTHYAPDSSPASYSPNASTTSLNLPDGR